MTPDQNTLFGPDETQAQDGPVGAYIAVALEDSLDKLLDYSVPDQWKSAIAVGQRVKVPLGKRNRAALGYVVTLKSRPDFKRVKPILEIDDDRVLVTPGLLELSRWMSKYYCSPLGTVIDCVIPSAVKKKIGLEYLAMVRLAKPRDEIQELFERTRGVKRRSLLARLLQIEADGSVELSRLADEAGVSPPTVRKLTKTGIISIVQVPDYDAAEPPVAALEPNPWLDLNEDQQKVFDDILPRLTGGFSVNLLFGVTGSGKTEIYLRCIEKVIHSGKQAIVMVPEIALTPQTVRRFTQRFPRVAVLHSGLTPGQRHRFWQQCASGRADVVVGARSAVFAPVPKLGMIVVDEEHEASYKQDQSPRYNGRDVAIKRAQTESCPVLLGSATPSLETYRKVNSSIAEKSDVYHMLPLPRRVRGLAMPHVELIDLKQESKIHKRSGIHLFSHRLEHMLRTTIDKGHQAILLLNRRGYSNFVYCASCQEPVQCKYCDTTMTYHRTVDSHASSGTLKEGLHTGQLQCHYCLAANILPDKCPTCGKKLSLFGLGTQRVEEELQRKFPDIPFARVDSDTMRNSRDYEALLERFAKGEIKIMLGTQMIAKGLDYPNVTLVGVISGDTALALPDFRAAERTFQLITQVAGRAGRGDAPGRVILQTFLPDDLTIQSAIKQDFAGFAARELQTRKDVGLPPFSRMVRIVLRDQDQDKLHRKCDELLVKLNEAVEHIKDAAAIDVRGPMPCAISRIAGYFRNQIVMISRRAAGLQHVLALLREGGYLATSDRIAVDVDPVSLL